MAFYSLSTLILAGSILPVPPSAVGKALFVNHFDKLSTLKQHLGQSWGKWHQKVAPGLQWNRWWVKWRGRFLRVTAVIYLSRPLLWPLCSTRPQSRPRQMDFSPTWTEFLFRGQFRPWRSTELVSMWYMLPSCILIKGSFLKFAVMFILIRLISQYIFYTACHSNDRYSEAVMTALSFLVWGSSQLAPERLNGGSQRRWDIPYNERTDEPKMLMRSG